MAQKGLPLLGEILSRKTLGDATEIFHEIHSAIEAAGGGEVTLAALAALSPSLGLTADAMEVLAVLDGAAGGVAASFYVSAAAGCLGAAVRRENLLGELEAAPDGFVKARIQAAAAVA
ncbi:hypothetical protein LJR225_004810 [Phenylobacterium sp. LjRoot225]|uniref:hypothetical protein n=1 Tax=Phenylobacterium sp. LjRoot225 TaxID=3342285 RepID=UPI003ECEB057